MGRLYEGVTRSLIWVSLTLQADRSDMAVGRRRDGGYDGRSRFIPHQSI